jgi:hypothetical protein
MITKSTTVSHGYTVPAGGKGLTYLLSLKSRYLGDRSPVSSFQFRALSAVNNEILSGGGGHAAGTSVVTIVPKRRPPLMHQRGVLIETGTTGIAFAKKVDSADQVEVATVQVLIQPVTGTTRIARGALTLDITSAGVVTYTGAQALYVNGAAVATGSTIAFPYPRLLTIAYTAKAQDGIVIGASTGTASFYLQQVGVSTRVLTAGEVATHAQIYYRKPSTVTVLTDSAISSVPSDNPVTTPEVWREI